MRYFEDFRTGDVESYGPARMDLDAMLAFARQFDPQPMHLDAASDQAKLMGGLIASGWHTCALNMRMIADHFILKSSGLGSPGVASVRWLAPIRPGTMLKGRMEVLGSRPSRSKPDRGLVNFRFALADEEGVPVFEQENLVLFARRHPGPATGDPQEGMLRPAPEDFPAAATAERIGPIEDVIPGTILRFGTFDFTAARIIAFAREFDPQPFHLDEAAGKASLFGGLAASGWHTASAWMRTVIDFWTARAQEAPLPRRGPGFGFRDMQWLKPVLAGDTLTYYARILEARPSASKPGWGILTQRNYALNQHGVPVFAFTGAVLWGTPL